MITQPVSFNNKEIPDFCKVVGRTYSALPSLTVNQHEFSRAVGGYFTGTKLSGKTVTLDFVIVQNSQYSLDDQADLFIDWLSSSNFTPAPLTFIEQPDKYILAAPDDNVDVEDLLVAGQGSITFTAVNPLKYSKTELLVEGNSPFKVTYHGKVDQGIFCKLTLSKDCSKIQLSNNTFPDRKITLQGSFKKGNVIEVDSILKMIKVDSVVNMKLLTLDSDWLKFSEGENILSVKLDDVVSTESIEIRSKVAFY